MQEIKRPKPPPGTVLFAILDSSRRRRGWLFWPFQSPPDPGFELVFEYKGTRITGKITKAGISIPRNLAYVTVEWDGVMPQTYGGEE